MGQSGIVHDFKEDLEFSQGTRTEEFWLAAYRKAFPNMVGQHPIVGDCAAQRQGIDRVISLSSGRDLKIDEKVRRKNYNDVLIEYLGDEEHGKPGWIEKDLAIDYIAYAFIPSRQCLLLPWPLLQRAWRLCGSEWQKNYPVIRARNPNYTTACVAVPIEELRTRIGQATLIRNV